VKYEELSEEERKHFDALVEKCGEPPKKATHFDMSDRTSSSWMRKKGWKHEWMYYLEGAWLYFTEAPPRIVEIPEKPWTTEEDK